MEATAKTEKLHFIQGLRGIAAIAVAITHLTVDANWETARRGGHVSINAVQGAAGVDLFFVISGFIMVYSSASLFGRSDAPATFLRRRLVRIAPLYWAGTIGFFLLTWIVGNRASAQGLLTSLLFLPINAADPGYPPLPLLQPGWTLNYEMMFYALFGSFIWLPRRRAATAILGTLAILVLLGVGYHPASAMLSFWTAPIILEFAAGMVIALARPRLPTWCAVLLVAAAIAWGLFLPVAPIPLARPEIGFHRLLLWGVPAALIITATYNAPLNRYVETVANFLGEISYAIYIVHVPVIFVFARIWFGAAHLTSYAGFVLVGLLITLLVAWIAYVAYDGPVRRLLSSSRRPLPAAVVAVPEIR